MGTLPTPRKRGRAAVADRARVMRRDKGLCQDCLARGILKPATQVDHPLNARLGLAVENLTYA